MKHSDRNAWRRRLAIVACAALVACGSDPLSPFQPQVSNATDNFSLQATGVTNVTATVTYNWVNTGTRATINHSTTTSAGSATLVIRDANGASVYNKALVPSLNEPTTVGVAGTWTVQVTLNNYSGTINFLAQKL